MTDGPMNLGPKDQRLPVKRDTLEALLVVVQPGFGEPTMPLAARHQRRAREAERVRRILRQGGE